MHKASGASLLLVAMLGFNQAAYAESFEARVVGVADGDTLTVLTSGHRQYKIRIAGIDAPEKGQPFGMRAKQALSDCAFGREAHVDGEKNDRYGRLVAKITVHGTDCGLDQIRHGMAWHYKRYAKEQSLADRLSYSHAEDAARASRVGLWGDHEPTPPWDYRKLKRSAY